MEPASARVTVSRTLPGDVGQRQVYVSLDGEAWVTMLAGQRAERTIAPGPHRIRFNNTLVWKTIEFDAAPDETIEFRFANTAGRLAIGFLAVMGVAPLFLKIVRVQGP
jgi:hypothetical protein